ncbi:MAG: winged helix DNA-binding protein [Candidatus Dormibacteraeota bacterium]|nr:winged helix DNA-binding protein [Candidatus Dormibacteraeota bacterium]
MTDDIPLPALLRASRGAYSHSIRRHLAEAGFEDMPRNGPYVLGGVVNRGGSISDLVPQLGVSKQAASELVDSLVELGFMRRELDVTDRRRIRIEVTDRGRQAAAAVKSGVDAVDAELATRLSPQQLAGLRTGLVELCAIREEMEDAMRHQDGGG